MGNTVKALRRSTKRGSTRHFCGRYLGSPEPNTMMSSWLLSGLRRTSRCPVGALFSHTRLYLNHPGLLITSALVNGCDPNSTHAPRGLSTRLICSHIGTKGMTASHLQAVVP